MSEKIEEVLISVLNDGENEYPDIEGEMIKDSFRDFNNKLILEI